MCPVFDTFESLPSIARKCTGEDVNVVEAGFKGLVEHVSVMVFELLCALNGNQIVEASSETIDIVFLVSIETVSQVI